MNTTTVKLTGLPRRFIADGLLDEATVIEAVQSAAKENVSFVPYLADKNILTPEVIAHAASHDFGVPLLDLNAFDTSLMPTDMVTEKLLNTYHAMPLYYHGKHLYVAIADPTDMQALNDIQFNSGVPAYPVIVEINKLRELISNFLEAKQNAAFDDLDDSLDSVDFSSNAETPSHDEDESDIDDAPVVRFVNKIILDALHKGASDIHFEQYEKRYRVRYRIDGILYEVASPPPNLASRIVARVKIMAHLDISERRVPQDGHFKMKLSRTRSVDFRVNTCPTVAGEKIVVRVLDAGHTTTDLATLGPHPSQVKLIEEALSHPQGMILVTGPTGSGKTVTIYSSLAILNQPERNISTVEDPVEINIEGINQANVNPKTGFTFASALRAFLRQDPDVIMVGEIRDLETAEIAIKASQTGHLVLSTLHTNSAPETLTRLMNMGVPTFNIATSVSLIVAQRLARKLCDHCKKPSEFPETALQDAGFKAEEIPSLKLFDPVGCNKCTNGYAGRVGLYEVLKISENLGRLIMEGGNALQLKDLAREEGMITLRDSGLNAVRAGTTSLEEANRITLG